MGFSELLSSSSIAPAISDAYLIFVSYTKRVVLYFSLLEIAIIIMRCPHTLRFKGNNMENLQLFEIIQRAEFEMKISRRLIVYGWYNVVCCPFYTYSQ